MGNKQLTTHKTPYLAGTSMADFHEVAASIKRELRLQTWILTLQSAMLIALLFKTFSN